MSSRVFTLLALLAPIVPAQDAAKPTFEIASVQKSPKRENPFAQSKPVRGGRWEIKSATMVDLIRYAYGYQNDKVLGGPNWLEMDRFDVVAKVPADSNADSQKLMLQALLADRFALKTKEEKRPLPTFALTAGKKPQMKEADGSEESGCKAASVQTGPAPEGGRAGTVMFATGGGGGSAPVTLTLGPNSMLQYTCRNISMARFVESMRSMFGSQLGSNPIVDETGLKGNWNFEFRYTFNLGLPGMDPGERLTFPMALEKQVGLVLEPRQVATPVIVVESVNQNPTPDSAAVAEALPPIAAATEFEVASVKPFEAGPGPGMFRFGMQPGGRFEANGLPLRFLLDRAFNTNNRDSIVDVPDFANTARFSITARVGGAAGSSGNYDQDELAPLVRSLLVDRFKMKYHTEDRPVNAYKLMAAKSKLKPADPANRANCKQPQPPAGSAPGTRMLVCQNVTMAEFADRLQGMTQELNWPVEEATGLTGRYDLTLSFVFSLPAGVRIGPGGGGGDAGPQASDPSGGYTIFEAIEKQLGLKLEKVKKPMPVVVIDHLEATPTEN